MEQPHSRGRGLKLPPLKAAWRPPLASAPCPPSSATAHPHLVPPRHTPATRTQFRSHDWIVDLSLNVLQAAWWISFASFLPFRTVYMSLRGMAPHTSTSLNALRSAAHMK